MASHYWQSRVGSDALLSLLAEACEPDHGELLRHPNWLFERESDFAKTWQPSLPALGKLLRQLLCHAGLEDYDLEIVDARTLGFMEGPLQLPNIEFISAQPRMLTFRVKQFGRWATCITSRRSSTLDR